MKDFKFDIQMFAGETISVGSVTTQPASYEDIQNGTYSTIYLISKESNTASFIVKGDSGFYVYADGVSIKDSSNNLLSSGGPAGAQYDYKEISVSGLSSSTSYIFEFWVYDDDDWAEETINLSFTTNADVLDEGTNNLSINTMSVAKMFFEDIEVLKVYIGSTLVYKK